MVEQAIQRAQARELIGNRTAARLLVALDNRSNPTEGDLRHDRTGNIAHLERLISTRSRDDSEVQATAGRLRRLVAVLVLATILDGLNQMTGSN